MIVLKKFLKFHNISKRLLIYLLWLSFTLSSLSILCVGILMRDADFAAMGVFMVGIMTSLFFWLMTQDDKAKKTFELKISRLIYVIFSGVALYINLAWALWMVGIPLSIGTVKDGHMAENYWLGPSVLAFAGFAYYYYHHLVRSKS